MGSHSTLKLNGVENIIFAITATWSIKKVKAMDAIAFPYCYLFYSWADGKHYDKVIEEEVTKDSWIIMTMISTNTSRNLSCL